MKQFWLHDLPFIIFFSLAWGVTTWAEEPHLDLVGASKGTAQGGAGLLDLSSGILSPAPSSSPPL